MTQVIMTNRWIDPMPNQGVPVVAMIGKGTRTNKIDIDVPCESACGCLKIWNPIPPNWFRERVSPCFHGNWNGLHPRKVLIFGWFCPDLSWLNINWIPHINWHQLQNESSTSLRLGGTIYKGTYHEISLFWEPPIWINWWFILVHYMIQGQHDAFNQLARTIWPAGTSLFQRRSQRATAELASWLW